MKLRHRSSFIAMALVALVAMASLASTASAAKPAPPYEDFAGCPSPAESAFVAFCFKYEFTGGHLQLGGKNIPVTQPIVFRGGQRYVTGQYLGNSEAGIVPTRQTVEGGLLGFKTYATVELAGTPGSITASPLSVPVKVHLENPVIGKTCYVGSNSAPIQLNLITGTTSPPAPNLPITGVEPGEYEEEAGRPEVLVSKGGLFVDNSFAAPAANGCALTLGSYSLNIDPLVNLVASLPSAAGHNETKLNFNLSLVSPEVVYP